MPKPRKPFWDNLIGSTAYVAISTLRLTYFWAAIILLRPKKP